MCYDHPLRCGGRLAPSALEIHASFMLLVELLKGLSFSLEHDPMEIRHPGFGCKGILQGDVSP